MTTSFFIRACAAAALFISVSGGATAQDAPAEALLPKAIIEGTWKTSLESEITIEACPEGFCGRLSRIVVPQKYIDQYGDQLKEMSVEQYFDANNKDPALRERPILNLQILTLWPSNNPFRYDGKVYNPEDGETYDGYVEVLGADTIRLNGCILYGAVCQGEDWMRVLVPEGETAEGEPVAPIPATRTPQ